MIRIVKVVRGGSYGSFEHKLKILAEDYQRFKGRYHGFRTIRRAACD
jgi:hypothetical protein